MTERHEVAVVTPETLALLDAQLANPGIPDMHRMRFETQAQGKGLYLAAWRDRTPLGCVLLHFKHPPHHASFQHFPEHAYVEALEVRPESRRQGVGRDLMEAAERRARGVGAACVGLSVGVENGPARALYRELGYLPSAIPDYPVGWSCLDPKTGEPGEEGEICSYWVKALGG